MINNPNYIHSYTVWERLPFTVQEKKKIHKRIEKQKDELKLPSSFVVVLWFCIFPVCVQLLISVYVCLYVEACAGFPDSGEHHDDVGFCNPKENTQEMLRGKWFSTRFTWISLYRVRHRAPIEQNICALYLRISSNC